MIEIKFNSKFGRGVFSTKEIAADTVIEDAPVIVFDSEATQFFIASTEGEKVLAWEQDENEQILSSAVACGLMMMCNHSDDPNAEIEKDFKGKIAKLVARRAIPAGQEVFIGYKWRKTF